ncbi:MAG: amidohydrolase family protein [Pirellulaceae bacterium]
MNVIRLQAKFIVVSSERILHPGQIVVQRGRVVEVTQRTDARPDIDLGEVALLPSLVNCHTHLEFSDLRHPLPAGDNFPAWIGAVVRYRDARQAQISDLIETGLQECFLSGTSLVGDIVTQPWLPSRLATNPTFSGETAWCEHLGPVAEPRVVAMTEVLGLTVDRFRSTVAWAEACRATDASQSARIEEIGISPHAPYSLLQPLASEFLQQLDPEVITAMHVAESQEERQWTEAGEGPFATAFERLGIPLPSQRMQINEAIDLLKRQRRSLLIHGNYLTPREMDQLAQAQNVSVVYCPRTHQHFGHAPYPWRELQSRNIRVVLGTDSLASNPDLQLWRELVTARQQHSELSATTALAAVTEQGAMALGRQHDHGSLNVGKLAYMNVVTTPAELKPVDLLEHLTTNDCQPRPLALSRLARGLSN